MEREFINVWFLGSCKLNYKFSLSDSKKVANAHPITPINKFRIEEGVENGMSFYW